MKTVKNTITKALIVFVALFALSMIPTGSSAAAIQPLEDASADCGVTDTDVVKYLAQYGYNVMRIVHISGCCDVIAYTNTTAAVKVYIQNQCIITHEDIGQ